MPSELLTQRRGTTLVLTISDPASRNTLSAQVIAAGIEALGVAEANPEIRCVVLQGADGHFCAGGNVQGLVERRAAGEAVQRRMLDHLHHWIETMASYPKPIVAAVEGAAAGAGFSLALACDLVVAAEDARFVMSHARLGLSPDGGATARLAAALPAALVKRMLWFAEPMPATTLRDHGLVAMVSLPGSALADALILADRLAALAPAAVASVKELVAQAPRHALAAQLAAERDHFLANLFGADGGEGLRAFVEKRAPRFS
ncbi:MAG: enoyl-CoA hydratase family protein [Pseudomonadota bacterium]|nr:enoyl-CoA hydratase family protein [Pseudomonadota bacterium]